MQPQPDVLGGRRRRLQVGLDLTDLARDPSYVVRPGECVESRCQVGGVVVAGLAELRVGEPDVEHGGVARPTVDQRGQAESPGALGCVSHAESLRIGPRGHWPVRPSMHSRSRSAWPQWRAYSSIMWTTMSRTSTLVAVELDGAAEVVDALVVLLGEPDLGRQARTPPRPPPGRRRLRRSPRRGPPPCRRAAARPCPAAGAGTSCARPLPCGAPDRAATSWTAAPSAAPAARRRGRRTSARGSCGSGRGTRRAPPSRRARRCRCRAGRPRGRATCRGTCGP